MNFRVKQFSLPRMASARQRVIVTGALLVLATPAARCVVAETFEIGPSVAGSDCVEEFETVANRLQPGDTLVLRGGHYVQSCRRALNIQGTAGQPILIRAAEGERPVLTRPEHNRNTENNIEIIDARHVTIQGLEFAGGSIGVRLMGDTRDFELAHSVIRDTGNTAFAANTGSSMRLALHHNTIHTTGQSSGETEGEGFYLGCHDGSCQVSDSRIEHNVLYNLQSKGAGGNDGIELKPGSGGNLIAHNRITGQNQVHDFPCVLVYGDVDDVNIVENNVFENCTEGIQVVTDAIVRGNVVIDSRQAGIVVRRHRTVGAPANVAVVNNTIVSRIPAAAGLYLALWRANDVLVFNNAVLGRDTIAIKGWSLRRAQYASNWTDGYLRGMPLGQKGVRVDRARSYNIDTTTIASLALAWFEDAGFPSPVATGSLDVQSTPRPQGSGIDIGAIEKLREQ